MRQTTPHHATSPSVSISANAQSIAKSRIYEPRVFTRRTRARFATDRTKELTRHLGRAPSYVELVLIGRVVANEWDLRRLDHRLDAGEELSGHAARLRLALENRLRLDLRELGLKPVAPKPMDAVEYGKLIDARRAAEDAAA